jgi:hypothetical protein
MFILKIATVCVVSAGTLVALLTTGMGAEVTLAVLAVI